VYWPKAIPKQNYGQLISGYGFLPDIMATFVDVANATYPEEYNGNQIVPTSGESLLPLFKGENKRIHAEPIFWEHEGNKAVRIGKYKLVSKWNKKRETKWELFDMETDRTEMNDLAEKLPEKVNEMSRMYKEWAEKNNILPWQTVTKLYENK
jgi:arylsulfatase